MPSRVCHLQPAGVGIRARQARGAVISSAMGADAPKSTIGLIGLAVMGQNLALNIAEKGYHISVYNRSSEKTDMAVKRAGTEGLGERMHGFKDLARFVASLERPRRVIILVKAGAPVDETIKALVPLMEPGDIIVDGGNEWYENTERRQAKLRENGLILLGMGVSGGEEGARRGPSMMPGGDPSAYEHLKPVLEKVAAQTSDGPCVTFVGPGGAGNFVKMVHNGIEYGDMQLIGEAYDVLKTMGGLNNTELEAAFRSYNAGELESFLIQISAAIFRVRDEGGEGYLVDKVLDKTGMKGTGKWTIQQAAELSVAAPTMAAALDGRFLSGLKEERVRAQQVFERLGVGSGRASLASPLSAEDKAQLIQRVGDALYASKVCSYAQGFNIIRAKAAEKGWSIDLGGLARIWKGGCIIRARFLDDIKRAYARDPRLPSLLVDPFFAEQLAKRQEAWREIARSAIAQGVPVAGTTSSLTYFDTYRRGRLPANLIQAQRDFFGSHTYERVDKEGWFHTVWDASFASADSITTSGYNN
ncbi:6-phosphogluconate dehydrogenase [Helicosporidium sp. ATCC 50920]|nr:6-phosphogluconate dehydrogenase [Helicosporidium sp. ATCC 50920]|eukprot:KDD75074.1 6-phosphogluconate dehydrogenase [Helicosporidium sp. ATCC 50920]